MGWAGYTWPSLTWSGIWWQVGPSLRHVWPGLGLTLCRCHLETLHNFLTRGPAFTRCTKSCKFCSWWQEQWRVKSKVLNPVPLFMHWNPLGKFHPFPLNFSFPVGITT